MHVSINLYCMPALFVGSSTAVFVPCSCSCSCLMLKVPLGVSARHPNMLALTGGHWCPREAMDVAHEKIVAADPVGLWQHETIMLCRPFAWWCTLCLWPSTAPTETQTTCRQAEHNHHARNALPHPNVCGMQLVL